MRQGSLASVSVELTSSCVCRMCVQQDHSGSRLELSSGTAARTRYVGAVACVRVCVASNMLWLCTQGYPLLSLKVIPQMPESSIKFSSHTWSGLLKHLHQVLSARYTATVRSDLKPVPRADANRERENGGGDQLACVFASG